MQRAVARILEAIYEASFLDLSYGFRPGRNPHQALRELRRCIVTKKVRWVYEADIQGYFNHINHAWLMRMLGERIADPVILRLIGKWLRAGAMVDGIRIVTGEGTPQGGPISPVLANIYLHYVLDLWFERRFKRTCEGEAYLVRFADDYVVCFQYRSDAERFHRELTDRLKKFGLELSPGKTRMMLFGRFAAEKKAQRGERPETFDFLGFTLRFRRGMPMGSHRVSALHARASGSLTVGTLLATAVLEGTHYPSVSYLSLATVGPSISSNCTQPAFRASSAA